MKLSLYSQAKETEVRISGNFSVGQKEMVQVAITAVDGHGNKARYPDNSVLLKLATQAAWSH